LGKTSLSAVQPRKTALKTLVAQG